MRSSVYRPSLEYRDSEICSLSHLLFVHLTLRLSSHLFFFFIYIYLFFCTTFSALLFILSSLLRFFVFTFFHPYLLLSHRPFDNLYWPFNCFISRSLRFFVYSSFDPYRVRIFLSVRTPILLSACPSALSLQKLVTVKSFLWHTACLGLSTRAINIDMPRKPPQKSIISSN